MTAVAVCLRVVRPCMAVVADDDNQALVSVTLCVAELQMTEFLSCQLFRNTRGSLTKRVCFKLCRLSRGADASISAFSRPSWLRRYKVHSCCGHSCTNATHYMSNC